MKALSSRPLLLVCFLSILHFSAVAQVDEVYTGSPEPLPKKEKNFFQDGAWRENLIWGGNFQAWFGNPTYIYLSPGIGYTFFDHLQLGLGAIYNHTSFQTRGGQFKQNIFGGHSYLRYVFAESFFLQVQYDRLKQPDIYGSDPSVRRWVNYFIGGFGVRQPMGEKLALSSSILYNFRRDPLSIYPGGFIVQFGIIGNF
jgi:hypothetical protein